MSRIILRTANAKVSLNKRNYPKNARIVDAIYNGGVEEHEDIADYFASDIPLKGVRVG
ncbi:hypothetical protein [Paenibacillus campinasensis]|uniref:hypothetical protein n=1 Tax=Paenibacillus campinasensis TaxID=66347 RepID=UPI0015CA38BA|nr:hypothetical protein [Paenibacillus campinasensis]